MKLFRKILRHVKKYLKRWLRKLFKLEGGNEDSDLKIETFRLAGVNYYEKNIRELARLNPQWKYTAAEAIEHGLVNKAIYKINYVSEPVKLVKEDKNPNDENAVAVYVAGELVGYIKRDENIHVRKLLKKYDIKFISAFIGGGDYKVVYSNKAVEKFSSFNNVTVKIGYAK